MDTATAPFYRAGPDGGGQKSPFRGRGGRGSPFRGRGGQGSPFRGRGGRGSPFRGRGGPGSPFRGRGGRGSPFRGAGGERGNSFRGANRGRGAFRGKGKAPVEESNVATSVSSTDQYLEMVYLKSLGNHNLHFNHTIRVKNLPPIFVQDTNEITKFIVEHGQVPIKKMIFQLPSDKSGSLSVIVRLQDSIDCLKCVAKLHGQVFRDHHLLVERFHESKSPSTNSVKFSMKKTTAAVTEETLWKLFETCGQIRMIYLLDSDKLEALINFSDSDSDSVVNALKLNGTKLDKNKIKVVTLDEKLMLNINPNKDIESLVKDLNVTHIVSRKTTSRVYFSDEESYSKALKLNKTEWNGEMIYVEKVDKDCCIYLADPENGLEYDKLKVVFSCSKIVPHPSQYGVHVIHFSTKSEVDTALKANPVLISNKLYNVADEVSKLPSLTANIKEEDEDDEEEEEGDEDEEEEEEEDDDEEEEAEDDDEEEDEEEEVEDEEDEAEDKEVEEEDEEDDESDDESDEEEVAAKPSNGVNGQRKQQPALIDNKRKRQDSKAQKGGSKKVKA